MNLWREKEARHPPSTDHPFLVLRDGYVTTRKVLVVVEGPRAVQEVVRRETGSSLNVPGFHPPCPLVISTVSLVLRKGLDTREQLREHTRIENERIFLPPSN